MRISLIGILFATVAMFVWGAVFWMSPLGSLAVSSMDADVSLGQAMLDNLKESGVYFVPDAGRMSSDPESFTELHEKGPLAIVIFSREGGTPMQPAVLIKGFLHMLVSISLVSLLLWRVRHALGSYRCRFGFVLLLGVTMGFYSRMGDAVWFLHPVGWGLTQWIYTVTAWAIAGAILARFVGSDPLQSKE